MEKVIAARRTATAQQTYVIAGLLMGFFSVGGAAWADTVSPTSVSDVPGTGEETTQNLGRQTATVAFDIPAQPLNGAILKFADAAEVKVFFDTDKIAGVMSQGVVGVMPPEDALARLLAGTGVNYRFVEGAAVRLSLADDDIATLSPIMVQGNSPDDPGRTAGTGSYAGTQVTVGSKLPMSIREVPQSVSVVTRQRIEDQQFTDLIDAMEQTTGMTVQQSETGAGHVTFYSRGFPLDSLQVDGMPYSTGSNLAATQDMAFYDRVEVLRGPAGLFQGAGEPSAVINLEHKRPLDGFKYGGAVSAGSWDFYRGEADTTGPITADGAVRGRLVAAYERANSFVDVVESERPAVYGSLAVDVTDRTTLTLGASRTELDAVPSLGLPTFADGSMVGLDRSTFIGADWNKWEQVDNEGFAELAHRFDNGAEISANAIIRDGNMNRRYAMSNTAVNATTGNVSLNTQKFQDDTTDIAFDIHGHTPFTLFDRTHKILVGADYRLFERHMKRWDDGKLTQNVYSPNHDLALPDFDTLSRDRTTDTEQYGAYGQGRFSLVDPVTLIIGGRASWWDTKQNDVLAGTPMADASVEAELTPYAGVIVDLNNAVSLYGSYAEIFQPQTATTVDGTIIPPRTGSQYEIGAKTELLDGALIGHIAAFRIQDENRATDDPDNAGFSLSSGEVRSEGFEAELSGEPFRGYQITAGYAYTTTEVISSTTGNEGETFEPTTPKHAFNLWGKYTFSDETFDGLSIGTGVKAVSPVYNGTNPRVQQHAYAVFDAQLGYRLTDKATLSLTAKNLFDKVYFSRLNNVRRQNHYGEPRSVQISLRKTF